MVLQLSYGLVIILTGFIILCIIILIAISPKAARDYKEYAARLKNTKKVELGDSLTAMLERLSSCTRRETIDELIEKIKEEAKKTSAGRGEQAQHSQTVLQWISFFDVERHISDLKKEKVSSQIRYDAERKDFKLLITAQDE